MTSASAKIERLLEVTGTPPDKRELARKNYKRLIESDGESAIDARLAEFETIQNRLAAWKQKRRSKAMTAIHQEAAPIGVLLAREKARARRFEEAIDSLSLKIGTRQPRVDISALEKITREMHWLNDSQSALPKPEKFSDAYSFSYLSSYLSQIFGAIVTPPRTFNASTSISEKIRNIILEIEQTDHGAKFAPEFTHIETDQTISGLGSLAILVGDLMPDVIFTLNKGGKVVGEFVQKHLNLTVPIVALEGSSEGVTAVTNSDLLYRSLTPLVIDDIARSGGTLSKAFSLITRHNPGTHPRAVTMAATVQAIESIGSGSLLTPNPTTDFGVRMPYDPSAGFAVEGENTKRIYVFGASAHTPENRLAVPAEMIDKVVAERSKTFGKAQ